MSQEEINYQFTVFMDGTDMARIEEMRNLFAVTLRFQTNADETPHVSDRRLFWEAMNALEKQLSPMRKQEGE